MPRDPDERSFRRRSEVGCTATKNLVPQGFPWVGGAPAPSSDVRCGVRGCPYATRRTLAWSGRGVSMSSLADTLAILTPTPPPRHFVWRGGTGCPCARDGVADQRRHGCRSASQLRVSGSPEGCSERPARGYGQPVPVFSANSLMLPATRRPLPRRQCGLPRGTFLAAWLPLSGGGGASRRRRGFSSAGCE